MSTPRFVTGPTERQLDQAWAAMLAAEDNNWDRVNDLMLAAHDESGDGSGLPMLVLVWCDTYIAHATEGAARLPLPDGSLPLAEPRSDVAHFLRPEAQWAARLIRARLLGQPEPYFAVFDELDGEPTPVKVQHFRTLLLCVADTLRAYPPGWALLDAQPGGG